MLAKVTSYGISGLDAYPITIEAMEWILTELVKFIPAGAICESCRDQTKCALCPFNTKGKPTLRQYVFISEQSKEVPNVSRNRYSNKRERARGKVSVGQMVATPNALSKLTHEDTLTALSRHVRGDWGDICEEDRQENELSLKKGFRLLSVYYGANGTKFWIITEADRSMTTVLLPEDY